MVKKKPKQGRNYLVDADCKIKCQLRKNYGPVRINHSPIRKNYGSVRKITVRFV